MSRRASPPTLPPIEQARLFEFLAPDYSAQAYLVSSANRAAHAQIRAWRVWPGRSFAVVGPTSSGKTHLAHLWAEEARAGFVPALATLAEARAAWVTHSGHVVIEDLDRGLDDEGVFYLLDMARAEGGAVLLTGRTPPDQWPAASKDLASRLNALPFSTLFEPDDALLQGVLRRICRARFIELPEPVAKYISEHMERSFAAAAQLGVILDQMVVKAARPVTKAQARKALTAMGRSLEHDGSPLEESEAE